MADKSEWKTPIKYGRRREGRWTPIRAKAQDTKANPSSWETRLVRKRWDIGLLRALSLWIMMMMMMMMNSTVCSFFNKLGREIPNCFPLNESHTFTVHGPT